MASPEHFPPALEARPSAPEAVALLGRLGLHRLVVPIPFEEEGPVNCWLVENGPEPGGLTLIDAAVNTEAGRAALTAGLTALGAVPADVRRVVVTHGHLDHYGNARWLDAPEVLAHPADWNKIAPEPVFTAARVARHRRLFLALGVDPERLSRLEEGWRRLGPLIAAPPRESLRPLEEGARLRFAGFEAEVLHLPGHTPGMCCLWIPGPGLLLSSDHLLEHTSPNPVMEPGPEGIEGKPRSLEAYLRSVGRVRELPVEWVAPGHGPLFEGAAPLIDRLLSFFDRRQTRIADWLAGHPGATALDVGAAVFPRALDRALFLVLSEVLGNLEVLESAGRVRREVDAAGVHRWSA